MRGRDPLVVPEVLLGKPWCRRCHLSPNSAAVPPQPLSGCPSSGTAGVGGLPAASSIWLHLGHGGESLDHLRICLQTHHCSSELLQSCPSTMVKDFSLMLHHLKLPNPAGMDPRATMESGMLLGRAGVVPAWPRLLCCGCE